MAKALLIPVILLSLSGVADGQVPDVSTIEYALNQSLELEFPHFQEIADVVVLQGGATADTDFLFLCTGRLRWKLSSADLEAVLRQEIAEEVERQAGNAEGGNSERALDELRNVLNTALSLRLQRIDSFQTGGTATLVKLRVRLEQAGADWIVTESKFKESDRNPLSVLDQ